MNHPDPTDTIHSAAATEPHACGSVLEDRDGRILSRDAAKDFVEELSWDAPRVAKPTSVTQEVLPPDP
jgi:hypothetical protein